MFGNHFADNAGAGSVLMNTHPLQNRAGGIRGHNCQKLSFIGHEQWIQTENLTRAFDRIPHGNGGFIQANSYFRTCSNLIKGGCYPAASRIAQGMNVRASLQHGCY